ncbi:MAG: hypothetical protein LBM02_02240 [Lachnospiraceae bacterium]|jgi:hypothetical protein|nr:hypothetical protein [Lachnospiraceae bacterium]
MAVVITSISLPSLRIQAEETTNPPEVLGVENSDKVADELIDEENIKSKQVAEEVKDDVEIVEDIGLPVENIEDVSYEDGEVSYEIALTDDLTNEITVEEQSDGDIVLNCTEGSIENNVIFNSDGTVYIDGEEVTIEIEDDIIDEDEYTEEVLPSTGGLQWYRSGKAPSSVKKASYGKYKEWWRCSSIKLQKRIGSIASSVLLSVISFYCIPAKLAAVVSFGGLTGALSDLKSNDPRSTSISYIDYVARAKKNARYYKNKRYLYSRKGFKGHRETVYAYGIML